ASVFSRVACGWMLVPATDALLRHPPVSSSSAAASAPSARSRPSARQLPAASSSRPALVSTSPACPAPLGSLRFVPSFSLAAVNRNFLLGSIRNFSPGRDRFACVTYAQPRPDDTERRRRLRFECGGSDQSGSTDGRARCFAALDRMPCDRPLLRCCIAAQIQGYLIDKACEQRIKAGGQPEAASHTTECNQMTACERSGFVKASNRPVIWLGVRSVATRTGTFS